jgi:hypothetical protein
LVLVSNPGYQQQGQVAEQLAVAQPAVAGFADRDEIAEQVIARARCRAGARCSPAGLQSVEPRGGFVRG